MKNMKKMVSLITAIIIMASCFVMLFTNEVQAAAVYSPSNKIKAPTSSPYEFSAQEYMELSAIRAQSTTNDTVLPYRLDLTGKDAILIHQYDENYQVMTSNHFGDGRINDIEASTVLCFEFGVNNADNTTSNSQARSAIWYSHVKHLACSIAAAEDGIDRNDVVLKVTVTTPQIVIDDLTIERKQYEINTATGITDEVMEGIEQARLDNISVFEKLNGTPYDPEGESFAPQQIVTVTATTTKNNATYRMAIATDDNWYMIKEDDSEDDLEFETELTYSAKVGTVDVGYTMDNGTCLPKYDKNNAKKDADVTAIISSKNDLPILTVDGEAVGADINHANADGWYYTTADSKKEIAKLYKFADYDNLEDNGTVVYDATKSTNNYRGKVKVVLGTVVAQDEELESTEYVSIQWPFRIIEDVQDPKEITEDTTKVTRTVTTNLPIDKTKLPDGWAFTDTELGKSQHQVYKVYTREKGDITETPEFTKNGGNDTVTIDVKVTWPDYSGKKPSTLPQTGAFTAVIVVIMIGFTGFAVNRYRKISK